MHDVFVCRGALVGVLLMIFLRGHLLGPRLSAADSFVRFEEVCADFFAEHEIPGAAISVTDRGRIVFAKGFGVSDLETGALVDAESRFRIASLSKPITAVAVAYLAQQGKLKLDDRVIDWLGQPSVANGFEGEPYDPRLDEVTIRMLLEHRGGWDRTSSYDPMFQSVRFAQQLGIPSPADAEAVIRVMFHKPLDFHPGTRFAYSNFGYCLLGRIIERATGRAYEEFLCEDILRPMGIEKMRLGRTRLEQRLEGEVRYYHPEPGKSIFQENLGEEVANPYGAWYPEAMDAHGGWVASVTDLARFALAIQPGSRPGSRPGVLSSEWVDRLYRSSWAESREAAVFYSLGWQNRVLSGSRGVNHWHAGSLPGTTSILILRSDGKNFVALLNTRTSPKTANLGLELDRLIHRAAATIGP